VHTPVSKSTSYMNTSRTCKKLTKEASKQSQRCLCIDLYIRHTHTREGQEIQAIRSIKRRPPTASRQVTSKQSNSGNPATRSELFRVLDMTVTRLVKLISKQLGRAVRRLHHAVRLHQASCRPRLHQLGCYTNNSAAN